MKAKRRGRCNICREVTEPGEEIEVFLKRWVHASCKEAEIARKVERVSVLKGVTILPTEYTPTPQYVGGNDRIQHRRANRARSGRP